MRFACHRYTAALTSAAAAETTSRPTRPRSGLVAAWFGVLLLLAVALHGSAFTVDIFNPDEAFLATQADVLLDGGSLYRDVVDRKPPLVPYLYAGAFEMTGSSSLVWPRVLAMLATALTALLVSLATWSRGTRRAGVIAGLLCLFAMLSLGPGDAQAANFELFMLPATVAAMLLARRGRWASSGVAIAAATLAKQTGVAMFLPVGYLALRTRKARPLGVAVLGFVVPVAIVAIALGPGDFLFWNVLGTGGYAKPPALGDAVKVFLDSWTEWVPLNLPLVVLVVLAWRDRRRAPKPERTRDTDLWLWFLGALVGVAVGWRFFTHYFLQLVPPAALLGALALDRRSVRVVRGFVAAAGVIAVGCAISAFVLRSPSVLEPNVYRAVAAAVEERSSPSDRLFVWGSAPEFYWASGQRPATRFLTTLSFLAGIQPGRAPTDGLPESENPERWREFRRDFDAHPPQVIVDTAPSGLKGAEHAPIRDYRSLATRMASDYCFVGDVKGMRLYERLSNPRDEPAPGVRGDDARAPVVPRCPG